MTSRKADLQPPLGVKGGPCKVVDRIRQRVQNVQDQQALIRLVESNQDLNNAQTALVYKAEPERGPAPFTSLRLLPHAQYRMDFRGITVPDVQKSLTNFRDVVKRVMLNLDKARGQTSALTQEDRDFLGKFQGNPKFDWEDKANQRTLVLGPESSRVDVITVYPKTPDPKAPADGCGTPKTADYRAPVEDLSGYRTFTNEDSAKGIHKPSGNSVYHQPGESPRSDRERSLPQPNDTKQNLEQHTPANPVYNTPGPSNESEGQKIHVRTPGTPGEEYGHPFKENIYPRRTDDASPGSRAATDVTAKGGIYPSYADKQHKQQSEAKLYARKYYQRHRGKIKSRAQRDYLHKKHSPEFKKEKSRRNSETYGWRFERIPSGGFRSNADRAKAQRDKKALSLIPFYHPNYGLGNVVDVQDQAVVVEQTDALGGEPLGVGTVPFFTFLRGVQFEDEAGSDAFFDLADQDFDRDDEESTRLATFYRETFTPGWNLDPGEGAQDLGAPGPYSPTKVYPDTDRDYRAPAESMNNISPTDNNPGSAKVIPEGHDFANKMASRVAAKMAEILQGLDPGIRTRSQGLTPKVHKSDDAKGSYQFRVPGSDGDTHTVKVQGTQPLAKSNLKVSCTCGFWRYQGPEHWAQTNGYLLGNPVGTAANPNAKDPNGKNRVCKHVLAALNHIKRSPAFGNR